MEPAILHGLGTALVTPFHAGGNVDFPSLTALVHAQIASSVNFLVPCGSTGEASTLSEDETDAVVNAVVEAAGGRVPVLVGCTHNATSEAVRRAVHLSQIDGVYGILSANPYYNKPSQQGQFQHFKAIAEATGKPLLLYNIPGRTAVNLLPETVLWLAELPNVIGIKESSGNLQQIGELLAHAPETFSVFAGDDYLALPIIAAGGKGLISVASNAVPKQVLQLITAALAHDQGSAREHARSLHGLTKALFVEPNPAPIKALLDMMSAMECDALRLPMLPVSEATRDQLRAAAKACGLQLQA